MPLTIICPPPRGRETRQLEVGPGQAAGDLTLGLINNAPDAALAGTERQFSDLLRSAAATHCVHVLFSYLPEVPRGPAARARLAAEYWPVEDLLALSLDALIVTGMEPGAGPLSEEPYWSRFAALVDWAQAHTLSSIWSCLAAHAAVLRLDGIQRQRLKSKCSGVFAHELLRGHPLLAGLQAPFYTPHSRWNELPVAALRAAGYTILSGSTQTGADAFAKEARSLFVFFQGHPEYEDTTLLKEYRRDVGRFARGEQAQYPSLPHGYFSPAATRLLEEQRERLLARPAVETDTDFPAESVARGLQNSWRTGAVSIYHNWLAIIAATKSQLPGSASHARAHSP